MSTWKVTLTVAGTIATADLKLENDNKEEKKQQIKILMTDFIKDPIKRRMCIEIFETKFHNLFLESKVIIF